MGVIITETKHETPAGKARAENRPKRTMVSVGKLRPCLRKAMCFNEVIIKKRTSRTNSNESFGL